MVKGTAKVGGVTIIRRQEESARGSNQETYEWLQPETEESGKDIEDSVIVEEPVVKRRGRPPGTKNREKIPALNDQGIGLADLTIGVSNSAIVALFGAECGLEDNEKVFLKPPLARIIKRLPAGDAAKAAIFLDPLILVFGLAVWARRIYTIKAYQAEIAARRMEQELLRSVSVGENQQSQQVQPFDAVIRGTVPAGGQPETTSGGIRGFRNAPETGSVTGSSGPIEGGIPDEILRSVEGNGDINGQVLG